MLTWEVDMGDEIDPGLDDTDVRHKVLLSPHAGAHCSREALPVPSAHYG